MSPNGCSSPELAGDLPEDETETLMAELAESLELEAVSHRGTWRDAALMRLCHSAESWTHFKLRSVDQIPGAMHSADQRWQWVVWALLLGATFFASISTPLAVAWYGRLSGCTGSQGRGLAG